MKLVSMSWTGTEDQEEGYAVFKCDDATLLSLPFPSFRVAYAINNAMNLCINSGYHQGTRDALGVMVAAVRGLE